MDWYNEHLCITDFSNYKPVLDIFHIPLPIFIPAPHAPGTTSILKLNISESKWNDKLLQFHMFVKFIICFFFI